MAKAGQIHIRIAPQTVDRVKTKTREMTSRNKPVSLAERIKRLNTYVGGWINHFALAETPSVFQDIEYTNLPMLAKGRGGWPMGQ